MRHLGHGPACQRCRPQRAPPPAAADQRRRSCSARLGSSLSREIERGTRALHGYDPTIALDQAGNAPLPSGTGYAAFADTDLRAIVQSPPAASSPSARRVMQNNSGGGTKPEAALRSALHRKGLRFRKNREAIAGLRCRPDVLFPSERLAVFVDGCFWHGCPQHGTTPQTNGGYWHAKLELNRRRDAAQSAALEAAGWTVVRIWEHTAIDDAVALVLFALGGQRGSRRLAAGEPEPS